MNIGFEIGCFLRGLYEPDLTIEWQPILQCPTCNLLNFLTIHAAGIRLPLRTLCSGCGKGYIVVKARFSMRR